MITVRSTSGLPTIPITDATLGIGGGCALPDPGDSEWYGGPDLTDGKLFLEAIYYPIMSHTADAGGDSGTTSFQNGFGSSFPWNAEAHVAALAIGAGVRRRQRNEFFYFECTTAWTEVTGVSILYDLGLSNPGDGFEIRYANVPSTRDPSSGDLFDYSGTPNYLFFPDIGTFPDWGPSLYNPTLGDLIADEGSLLPDETVIINNVRGKAIVFLPKDDALTVGVGTQLYYGFTLNVVA